MKKILIYIMCFLMTWLSISYALTSFENAPKLISSTDTSLNITWDKIDSALWYYVYYSETSGSNYRTFWDILEENKAIITWLKAWKTYYVVITYLDKNTNEESAFSPEWVFNTKIWDEEKFSLDEVKVMDTSNLELTFNSWIDQAEDAIREFKITKDNKEVSDVKEIKLNEEDDKKINLILETPLEKGEYKITVIYITDSTWRNIEEWINWELKFMVTETWVSVQIDDDWWVEVNLNSWDETVSVETSKTSVDAALIDENIELNAGTPEETNSEYYGLAWRAMTGVLSTWETVWTNSWELPKTWPESIFLVFISSILGLIYLRKRKTI